MAPSPSTSMVASTTVSGNCRLVPPRAGVGPLRWTASDFHDFAARFEPGRSFLLQSHKVSPNRKAFCFSSTGTGCGSPCAMTISVAGSLDGAL